MKTFIRYGTYGFLSMMMAAQMAMANTASEKIVRTALDAKKSGRAMKRDLKKTGTYKNTKDEVKHFKKHHIKESE